MSIDNEIGRDAQDRVHWEKIAGNVVEKLRDELPYSSQFIKVTMSEGWLTLEGELEWTYQRDRAERAVRGVCGIIGVSNNIEVRPYVAPSEIKRRIEDALRRNNGLAANPLAGGPVGSKVQLRGSIKSWAERTEA
jgi:osmotically-inducible protein OsmY